MAGENAHIIFGLATYGSFKRRWVDNHIRFPDSEEDVEPGSLKRSLRTPEYDILSAIRLAASREKIARERGIIASLSASMLSGFDY